MAKRGMKPGTIVAPIWKRFWSKVTVGDDCCWYWFGGKAVGGYGRIWFEGKVRPAHRVAYILRYGPVPDDLDIDHLCRTPSCVNPEHLEPVTHQENMRRGYFGQKTHCAKGHPYDEQNTAYTPRGTRRCKRCNCLAQIARQKTEKGKEYRAMLWQKKQARLKGEQWRQG